MRTILAFILGGSLLAGCGGGGGSSGGPAPAPAPLLAITATNQDAVGSASVRASTALLGAGGGATATPSSASPRYAAGAGTAHRAAPMGALASLIAGALTDLNDTRRGTLAAGRTPLTTRSLAIAPNTTGCDFGGTLTTSFTDADNSQAPSIGDTMTLTFNQCKVSATDVTSGAMAITFNSVGVANNLLSFVGSVSMSQFSVSDGTRSASLDGGLTMEFHQRSASVIDISLTVNTGGLTAVVSGGASTDTVSFEAGFAMNDSATLVVGGVSFDTATISGSFSATSLGGGRLTLETPTALVQMDNEDFPRSGALRVVGKGSALRLTVLDATSVHVELDATLDGTYEASKDVPWGTLLPG
jgi:hypothetical protein